MTDILINAAVVIGAFSMLIIAHELGHFSVARLIGVRVERFAVGFGKKIFGIKRKDTEYVLNIFPMGGYVKLAGEDPNERTGAPDEFFSKPVGLRFWLLASGSLANYLFAFVILVLLYTVGMPEGGTTVGSVLKCSPAEAAGIIGGDKILSIDGKAVKYWNEILDVVFSNKDASPMDVRLKRGENEMSLTVAPTMAVDDKIRKHKIIGIAPGTEEVIQKVNLLDAVVYSARDIGRFTVMTYKGIWYLITGTVPVKGSVGGPIQIVELFAMAVKYGWVVVLKMMATVSMALAVFNLLPFPVLDGGHILFLAIEKIRKKPLSVKTQETITQVAAVLLIMFVIYVSYFDTVRVFGNIRK